AEHKRVTLHSVGSRDPRPVQPHGSAAQRSERRRRRLRGFGRCPYLRTRPQTRARKEEEAKEELSTTNRTNHSNPLPPSSLTQTLHSSIVNPESQIFIPPIASCQLQSSG